MYDMCMYACLCGNVCMYACIYIDRMCVYIKSVSRIVDITAGGDFLGLCDQKISNKGASDFERLRCYDRLNLRIEGNDY